MPSCREYSERYTSRPSPPFNARHFAAGTSKKGNDGKTYIVSRPNVNGVKRWVKKSSKTSSSRRRRTSSTSSRTTPRRSRGTRVRLTVADDIQHEYYSKVVTAVYSRPSHTNWIFYDMENLNFYLPEFPYDDTGVSTGSHDYMAEFDVDMALAAGAIVWIVNYIPDPFQK